MPLQNNNYSRWRKNAGTQTVTEEIINAVIHGLGAALSIAALVIFTVFASAKADAYKIVSSILFASSALILYLSSVFYHSVTRPSLKKKFKLLDHVAIYLLIAGTYSPFTLVTLHGALGWTLFGIIWSLALLGTIYKIFFIDRFDKLSLIIYLSMGWLVIVAIKPLWHSLPFNGFLWLVAGGICYTAGTFFYIKEQYYYSHAMWHLCVLAGTTFHFMSILFYVVLN